MTSRRFCLGCARGAATAFSSLAPPPTSTSPPSRPKPVFGAGERNGRRSAHTVTVLLLFCSLAIVDIVPIYRYGVSEAHHSSRICLLQFGEYLYLLLHFTFGLKHIHTLFVPCVFSHIRRSFLKTTSTCAKISACHTAVISTRLHVVRATKFDDQSTAGPHHTHAETERERERDQHFVTGKRRSHLMTALHISQHHTYAHTTGTHYYTLEYPTREYCHLSSPGRGSR